MEIHRLIAGLGRELNAIQIPTKIGKSKLSLSTRAISDMIEKYCIDILMSRYGPNMVRLSEKGKPYDVVIEGESPLYINIKTELKGQLAYDAIWICSESVLRRMSKMLKEILYYLRLEYAKNDVITINKVSYAGPLSALGSQLIIYDKPNRKMARNGKRVNYRIATHYNGKHVHLLTSSFIYI